MKELANDGYHSPIDESAKSVNDQPEKIDQPVKLESNLTEKLEQPEPVDQGDKENPVDYESLAERLLGGEEPKFEERFESFGG